MTEKRSSEENLAIGQRIQEKFDLYLLGLIFTTLALSIQTAKFGISTFASITEILSWALLLIAGLVGLWRLEFIPEMYRLTSLQHEQIEKAMAGEAARFKGEEQFYIGESRKTVTVESYIRDAREGVTKVEKALEPIERTNRWKYRVMRATFVLGLVTLMIGRASAAIQGVQSPQPTTQTGTPPASKK